LRDEMSLRGRVLETIRDMSNHTITLNPLVRPGYTRAAVIFVSSAETQDLFGGALREKTVVFLGPNLPDLPSAQPRRSWHTPPRFLFVGRLLYWKGVNLAVRSLALVSKQFPGAHLTIRGSGPERARLEDDIRRLGLQVQVEFIPRLPQEQLFALYESHDLLLFPSLHDSGGFAALEAISYGMPVVCLDLGGPKDLVTSKAGVIVNTVGRNTAQVVTALADEIVRLLKSDDRLPELSAGAIARAQEFISARRVKEFYDRAAPFLGHGHEQP
jgi:glycosyltransferase involved in cell wall biosynthesis